MSRTSYSALVLHRSCPQAWAYRHIDGLYQVERPADRIDADLGSWWHAVRAADSIERGRALGSLVEEFVPARLRVGNQVKIEVGPSLKPETVFYCADEWWADLNEDDRESWTDRIGRPLPEHLRDADHRYRLRWETERENEAPVGVEVRVSRPLPTGTDLNGAVDEVYRDQKRGLLVARDHKFNRTLPNSEFRAVDLDSQLHLYAWALSPLLKHHGVGSVQAVAYDRTRSAMPKTPQITQAGNLSKSVSDYDLTTYLSWVGDGVKWGEEDTYWKSGAKSGQPKFGVYEADPKMVDNLSTPEHRALWHDRTLQPLNRNIVRHHLQAAIDTDRDTDRTRERYAEHGQAPRNFGRACTWCEYASLCHSELTGGRGGDYDLAEHRLTRRDSNPTDRSTT